MGYHSVVRGLNTKLPPLNIRGIYNLFVYLHIGSKLKIIYIPVGIQNYPLNIPSRPK